MKTAEVNCIDVVSPLVSELYDRGLEDFQIMGGIGSAVLKHAGTEILPDEQLIVAASDFMDSNADLCLRRKDGTLRDLDMLVLSDDPAYITEVEEVAGKVIEDQLEISIFGLRDGGHLEDQRAHPFGMVSLKAWVSDRYVDQDDQVFKALTPFAVPVPQEAMESWTALIGGKVFPVMNPAAALASYLTRSISGLRPKDYAKVQAMAAQVADKWPGAAEWLTDGPGQSQMALASIFQTLRRDNMWNSTAKRVVELPGIARISAGDVRALTEHEAFIFKDADEQTQKRVLKLAIFKARLLGTTESNPFIVTMFQKFAEKKLDTVTKNK